MKIMNMMMNTEKWLRTAEALIPTLFKTTVRPCRLIELQPQEDQFQGWTAVSIGTPEDFYNREHQRQLDVTFDFGNYCVGWVRFEIETLNAADCPLRLEVKLGEVLAEIGEDFKEYNGSLGRSWLQEDILVLDQPGGIIRLSRRYAFRYLRIRGSYNGGYRFRLRNLSCETTTSADLSRVTPLPPTCPPRLRELDRVGLNTLKNCMQTVFEDGPKRDRRLWLGDFRLQAMVNYCSFKNYDLCKRCLYLFAATVNDRGCIAACLYERPQPHSGDCFNYDYTALFVPTLLEYAQASGDWQTARELWPVAQRQMELVLAEVDDGGVFRNRSNWWLFIDWVERLDRQASEQGLVIYALKKACELSRELDRKEPCAAWCRQIEKMSLAAVSHLFDPARKVFVSGPQRQISWASQVWMALAGVLPAAEAAATLRAVAVIPEAVKPAGPYLYHYVAEAMFAVGMKTEAYALMEKYWGAMVNLGADTFWEIFDPENPHFSPYGSHLINSYCHAWSCTPSYFLRRDLSRENRTLKKTAAEQTVSVL